MKSDSRERVMLGRSGEDIAEKYLKGRGYRIIRRNISVGHSDIDILAEKGDVLVFVEVRTRSSSKHGMPEESLSWRKLSQMRKTAGIYLAINRIRKRSRIDAVCIIVGRDDKVTYFRHYTGI